MFANNPSVICIVDLAVRFWSDSTLSQTKRAHEVVRMRTSKPTRLRKRLPIVHRANFIDSILLGFSAIFVTRCIYWNESPCCLRASAHTYS